MAFGAAGAAVAIAVVSLLALGFLRGSDPDDTGEMTDPALDNLEVLVITILDPGLRVLELPSGRDSIFAQARVVENLKWSLAYEHMLVQFADRPGQYAIVEYLTGRTSVFSFDESDSNPRWAI